MTRRIGVFVLALLLVNPSAWAMRTRMHELAESPYYKEKLGGMIGRGVINVGTFFVDLLVNTVNETKAGPPLIGTMTGLAKGVGCSVLRLGSGAVDVTTFWVPGFNGFPVSDSYENCVGPAGASRAVSTPSAYTSPAASQVMIPAESEPEPLMPVQTAPSQEQKYYKK